METTYLSELKRGSGSADRTIDQLPLVVDLDGTLTPVDTLMESIILLIKRSPLDAFRLPFWLLQGRAVFKEKVAERAAIQPESLPLRAPLIEYLRAARTAGRRVVLATAAHYSIAQAVAEHIGVFDEVLASDRSRNLKGSTKLDLIRERIKGDFVYVGDSAADLPIWRVAGGAILAGASPGVGAAVRRVTPVEAEFPPERITIGTWLRALRVYQWPKNTLLFVPLLTAFSFVEIDKLAAIAIAFMAFSLAASATYLANDLWDLQNDRAHPRKRQRPLASGRISASAAVTMGIGMLGLAVVLAALVSRAFLLILLFYVVFTTFYSWVLKRKVLMDVVGLSLLYTLRILAGAVAIQVTTSSWLLAFSVFVFLSLALVKRCAELVNAIESSRAAPSGREYMAGDLVVLWPLGVGAALCSAVVFGLFISAPETQARYHSPQILWLVAVGLIHWLSRLWIKTSRGQMLDDPLIFAVGDRGSRITLTLMVLTILVARYAKFGFL